MWTVFWWFTALALLGWFTFPLTAHIFHKLPGRGFAFSRPLGLLIWGILFWLLTSWGILNNDFLSQNIALGVVLLLSAFAVVKWGWNDMQRWLRLHWRMVLSVEWVFLVAFVAFVVFRSTSPAIYGTEKPMEMAFLNAILRSESFPPHDPWLSGYAISYYYFGYVLVAMLTRLTGTVSTVAFNLAQAAWFGMIAAASYGLLVDLFALWRRKKLGEKGQIQGWMLRWAILAPILILLMGNAYGFLDILHARGVFWQEQEGSTVSGFWGWMDLRGLNEPPDAPYQWEMRSNSTVSWWDASRVLQDTDYSGQRVEIIDEFPHFSFVLGDLHAHVLATPFVLLAVSLTLNFYIAPVKKSCYFGKIKLLINPGRFMLDAGLIGGLAFLNTWDWPIYVGLYSAVFLVRRVRTSGRKIQRLFEFLAHGLGMALVGVMLYLPFFWNFSSQASGFLPSIIYFTRGVHFWVMFFPLLIPLMVYLLWLFNQSGSVNKLVKPILLVTGFVVFLVGVNLAFANTAVRLGSLGELFLANQGAAGASLAELFHAAGLRRISSSGTWVTLCGLLILNLSAVFSFVGKSNRKTHSTHLFILLLILWGCLLTLLPEFVYLLDHFGTRMNTIFKFYFQSWILWSLAGAFGVGLMWRQAWPNKKPISKIVIPLLIIISVFIPAVLAVLPSPSGLKAMQTRFSTSLLDGLWALWAGMLIAAGVYFSLRRQWLLVFRVIVITGLTVSAVYPVLAVKARSNSFRNPEAWTLDGADYYRKGSPDLMDAVDWLWTVEPNVLVEAVGDDGGDYSLYGRVSTLSGMPAVLGWRYHESQWRGGEEEIGSRAADVALLYESPDWETAQRLIDKYNIEYIYMGDLESSKYDLQVEKFYQYLEIAFQKGDVLIFQCASD
jgi:YYY domain-containing protein